MPSSRRYRESVIVRTACPMMMAVASSTSTPPKRPIGSSGYSTSVIRANVLSTARTPTTAATDALKRWEPRVVVKSVSVTREVVEGEDVLAIRVRYAVISQNVAGNQVLVDQTVMVR